MTDTEALLRRMANAIEASDGDSHVVASLRQIASKIALEQADVRLVELALQVGASTMASLLEGAA